MLSFVSSNIYFFKKHAIKIAFILIAVLFSYLAYHLYMAPVEGLQNKFVYLLKSKGYIILFAWSILEGELGLIMAGLLCYTRDMEVWLAVFIAGLGAFVGDQIYFYVGRYNKTYVYTTFKGHRRKFALAHLMLKKYGWIIIFAQRYMYGMRAIIPISIGLTKYDAKKFALINLISAWSWASVTIIPVWYFGEEILSVLELIKSNFYYVPVAIFVVVAIFVAYYYTQQKKTKSI